MALYFIFCIIPTIAAVLDALYNGSGWY